MIPDPSSPSAIPNAFTVDLEEHFQVQALAPVVGRDSWEGWESRVAANTGRLLELLAGHRVNATFFVLGWVARRHPGLVRRIVDQGHELASHGWDHTPVHQQTPDQFLEDVTRTKGTLEDLAGVEVSGFRAATWSITWDTLWALRLLQRTGHRYSSSIFPIRHDLYGMPEAPRFPFRPLDDGVVEIPGTTLELGGRRIPAGGGGWFRLFPYPLSRWMLERINRYDGQPGVFYCHPWELDPDQPLPRGLPLKSRFRHTVNLERMAPRLERLLGDFAWDRMDRVFAPLLGEGTPEGRGGDRPGGVR